MISRLQTSLKQKIQRNIFKESELERRYYKLLKLQATTVGFMPLRKLPKIHIKNYCILSGKARSVYSRKLRLSRHQIKAYFNYITDLKISSW
jgi:ribosomal protein S14